MAAATWRHGGMAAWRHDGGVRREERRRVEAWPRPSAAQQRPRVPRGVGGRWPCQPRSRCVCATVGMGAYGARVRRQRRLGTPVIGCGEVRFAPRHVERGDAHAHAHAHACVCSFGRKRVFVSGVRGVARNAPGICSSSWRWTWCGVTSSTSPAPAAARWAVDSAPSGRSAAGRGTLARSSRECMFMWCPALIGRDSAKGNGFQAIVVGRRCRGVSLLWRCGVCAALVLRQRSAVRSAERRAGVCAAMRRCGSGLARI